MLLQAMMSLDAAGFNGPLQATEKQMGASVRGLGRLAGRVLALGGAFLSIRGVMRGLSGTISMGADLDHQSKQTGIAVDQLVILRQAFDDTGVGADSLAESMAYMQRNMEQVDAAGESTNRGFQRLGINLQQFRQMEATDQLELIKNRLGDLGTQSEKTAAVMDIFGRSGSKMLRLFESGDPFGEARDSLGEMPALMARNAASFEQFDTLLGRARGKFTGMWGGILESAMPALNSIMAHVDKIDFSRWGAAMGNAFQTGLAIFQTGQAGRVVELSLGIAFTMAVNNLIGPLQNRATWGGIGRIILAGFTGIGAGLIKIFEEPILIMQARMDQLFDELFANMDRVLKMTSRLPGLGALKIPGLRKGVVRLAGVEQYGEARTFGEHFAARREDGTFLSRSGEESERIASEMMRQGAAMLREGVTGHEIFDTAGMRSELMGIVDATRDGLAAIAPQVGAAVAGAVPAAVADAGEVGGLRAGGAGAGGMDAMADRLAKIGLFVGGGGNQAATQTRLAERTARATETMGGLLRRLVDMGAQQPAAVWA